MEMVQQPVLHVEARVKTTGDGTIVRTDLIRDDVTRWLIDNFVVLSLGQEIHSFDGLTDPYSQALDSIRVTECSGGERESGAYRLQQVQLDVQAYQLHAPFENDSSQNGQHHLETAEGSEDGPKARALALPSKELDGLWESLQFDQPVHSTLLDAITRMVSFAARKLNKWAINWNRLVLLWGPPGTGKTSLCRGLAQKLAIRLGKYYPQSKLVEINAHSLGSKFFGESGKLVSKVFDSIATLLEEEEDTFVCVFVDEIETIAARRERVLGGNEPFDAVRAVNALLTGLDKLRSHPNVVIICTSNLVTALDQAFLDRVDVKQFMPHLSHRAIYGIYKDCLEELSRCDTIQGSMFDVIPANPEDPETALLYVEEPANDLTLPTYEDMLLNYQTIPESTPKQLADAASASVGLSGRTLRRLPILSLVFHSHSMQIIHVRQALGALRMGIASEIHAQTESRQQAGGPHNTTTTTTTNP